MSESQSINKRPPPSLFLSLSPECSFAGRQIRSQDYLLTPLCSSFLPLSSLFPPPRARAALLSILRKMNEEPFHQFFSLFVCVPLLVLVLLLLLLLLLPVIFFEGRRIRRRRRRRRRRRKGWLVGRAGDDVSGPSFYWTSGNGVA